MRRRPGRVAARGARGAAVGDVRVLDGSGNHVASPRTVLGLARFDPRGLLFTADGKLPAGGR